MWDGACWRTKPSAFRAIEPPALSDQWRREQTAELRKYFSEVDARRKPGSPEQAEEILTEAISKLEADIRCANHIAVLDDITLMHRLRA